MPPGLRRRKCCGTSSRAVKIDGRSRSPARRHSSARIAPRLESQAESELYDARIAGGRDLPEQRRSDVQARVVELRMIQHIEEIGAQFRLQAFAPDRCNLGDCQVYVRARRSAKRVRSEERRGGEECSGR